MFRLPRIIGGLALFISLIMMSGCGGERTAPQPGKNVSSGFPVVLQDDLGRPVSIEKEPQRIVSLSPSKTEILYAIGLDSRIVGVTTYCDYPAAAEHCKKIGGFSDPNLEMIVALDPDLVVVESIHRVQIPALEEAGIPVLGVEPKRLEDISGAVEMIGQATGKQKEAKRLADDIREKIEQVRNEVASKSERPLVYYEVWHEPLMTVGPGTLIDDLITVCGGTNLAGDAATHYPELSAEFVILRNPDIIIYQESHGVPADNPLNRGSGWQSIKAIQTGQVKVVDPDIFNRAGPRIIQALDELLHIIHPETEVRGD